MNKLMKTVYCYNFPEVGKVMDEINYFPRDLFKVTTPVEKVKEKLVNLYPEFKNIYFPQTEKGYINLDEIDKPILNWICKNMKTNYPYINLYNFNHKYFTSGSSEGIREILKWIQQTKGNTINIFKGEYEGYKAYAEIYGMNVNVVSLDDYMSYKKGIWFISIPSAINGNTKFIKKRIKELQKADQEMILDFTYAGMHDPRIDLNVTYHPGVLACVFSLSKPFGLFRYRMGFTVSKKPIESLYANKWFKDIERLLQMYLLFQRINRLGLYEKYKKIQQKIINLINENLKYNKMIQPSDVFLLANRRVDKQAIINTKFLRGDYYRFCLTKYFEEYENE